VESSSPVVARYDSQQLLRTAAAVEGYLLLVAKNHGKYPTRNSRRTCFDQVVAKALNLTNLSRRLA